MPCPIPVYLIDPLTDDSVILENGAVPVVIQDQTSPGFVYHLIYENGTVVMAASVAKGDNVLLVPTGTMATPNDNIVQLTEDGRFYQGHVLSITPGAPNDTVTIDTPFDYDFTVAANIRYGSVDLRAVASLAVPAIANISPPSGVKWDVREVRIYIEDDIVSMDNTLFGGGAALTNGVFLRRVDGEWLNYGNAKTNRDLEILTDMTYVEKTGGGNSSLIAKARLADILGVTARLDGTTNDKMEFVTQDNTTGQILIMAFVLGHVVV